MNSGRQGANDLGKSSSIDLARERCNLTSEVLGIVCFAAPADAALRFAPRGVREPRPHAAGRCALTLMDETRDRQVVADCADRSRPQRPRVILARSFDGSGRDASRRGRDLKGCRQQGLLSRRYPAFGLRGRGSRSAAVGTMKTWLRQGRRRAGVPRGGRQASRPRPRGARPSPNRSSPVQRISRRAPAAARRNLCSLTGHVRTMVLRTQLVSGAARDRSRTGHGEDADRLADDSVIGAQGGGPLGEDRSFFSRCTSSKRMTQPGLSRCWSWGSIPIRPPLVSPSPGGPSQATRPIRSGRSMPEVLYQA
jgi:hypothetical protein